MFVLPNPPSKEIREKIIQQKQNYVNENDITKWLAISQKVLPQKSGHYTNKLINSAKAPRPRTKTRVSKQTMDQIIHKTVTSTI